MANDYKDSKIPPSPRSGASRGGSGRGMNPMFLGVIIGLLLGIVLALGIAIWLNRSASPFQEKSRPVDALPTILARPAASSSINKNDAPAVPNAVAKNGSDKPRFEFYDILPGEKGGKMDAASKATPPAGKSAESPAATSLKTAPEAKRDAPIGKTNGGVATPAGIGKESYLLQAGAFQNESEAENLKAQIAFAGMEAFVRSVNLPDKGTLYRVRLGPYKSFEEVNRIKTALSQNGISAAVVKAE